MKDNNITYIFYIQDKHCYNTFYNIIQEGDHKLNATFIATTFLGLPLAQQVDIWVIALSIFFVSVLQILLILDLIIIGFFNKKKKMGFLKH